MDILHAQEELGVQSYFEERGIVSENEWGQPVYGPVPRVWYVTSKTPRRETAHGSTLKEALDNLLKLLDIN